MGTQTDNSSKYAFWGSVVAALIGAVVVVMTTFNTEKTKSIVVQVKIDNEQEKTNLRIAEKEDENQALKAKLNEPSFPKITENSTPMKGNKKIITKDGRFVKYDTHVVYDSKTGLEWFAGPNEDTTWDEAHEWISILSVDGGRWRMSTKVELKSLYIKTKVNESKPIYEKTKPSSDTIGYENETELEKLARFMGKGKQIKAGSLDLLYYTSLFESTGVWIWAKLIEATTSTRNQFGGLTVKSLGFGYRGYDGVGFNRLESFMSGHPKDFSSGARGFAVRSHR